MTRAGRSGRSSREAPERATRGETPAAIAWGTDPPRGLALRPADAADRDLRLAVFAAARDAERRAAGWPEALWTAFVADQFAKREAHWARVHPTAEVLVLEAAAPALPPARIVPAADRRLAPVGTLTLVVEEAPDAGADEDATPATARIARVGRIVDVALLPEARGRGFGTSLVESLARAARRAGLGALVLDVHAINTDAARFYRRLGFHRVDHPGPATHHRMVRPLTR